jgi:A/G-specific adenine glycosylase
MTPKQFQTVLLNWFDQYGRKDLPWQKNKTPYRVWVSEIMLQQTQVSTVIPYFQRFIEKFPDVKTLADAKEDDVLHYWTGLGYYQRARNLQRAAKIILTDYHGQFPQELAELEDLPGIGRSTAGAILSIAFEKKAAILDGNVKRVLTRLHGITEWPGEKKVLEQLWALAEKYTPVSRNADYSQAIMDLGATLCVRGKPRCDQCPFNKMCAAYAQGIEKKLPQAKPRKILPVREIIFVLLRKNPHFVLLEKRPSTGVWANLWSLPELSINTDVKKTCQKRFNVDIQKIELADSFRHTFSHFHLNITPATAFVNKTAVKIMEEGTQIWYNLHDPQKIGLPAPVKFLLEKLPI